MENIEFLLNYLVDAYRICWMKHSQFMFDYVIGVNSLDTTFSIMFYYVIAIKYRENMLDMLEETNKYAASLFIVMFIITCVNLFRMKIVLLLMSLLKLHRNFAFSRLFRGNI